MPFDVSSYIIPTLIVIAVLILCLTGYIKAPPDVAYIISGFRKNRDS